KQPGEVVEAGLSRFALIFGDEHRVVGPLVSAIRRRISDSQNPGELDLRPLSGGHIGRIVSLGQDMAASGLLERLSYTRRSKTAAFEPTGDPILNRFLVGIWLEHYVLLQVLKAFGSIGARDGNTVLANAAGRRQGGGGVELDLLVGTPSRVY